MTSDLAAAEIAPANRQAIASVDPTAPGAAAPAEMPAPVRGLLEGRPPALTVPPVRGRAADPITGWLQQNFEALTSAGVDFVDLEDGRTVLFNSNLISAEDVQQAAQEGTLEQIAPPVTGGAAPAPVPSQSPASGGLADAPISSVGAESPPADFSRRLASARVKQTVPQAPSKKPIPGGGVLSDLTIRPI